MPKKVSKKRTRSNDTIDIRATFRPLPQAEEIQNVPTRHFSRSETAGWPLAMGTDGNWIYRHELPVIAPYNSIIDAHTMTDEPQPMIQPSTVVATRLSAEEEQAAFWEAHPNPEYVQHTEVGQGLNSAVVIWGSRINDRRDEAATVLQRAARTWIRNHRVRATHDSALRNYGRW